MPVAAGEIIPTCQFQDAAHIGGFVTLTDLTKESDAGHHLTPESVYRGLTVTINTENVEENLCACSRR